jgi:hypothetical protein
MLQNVVLGGEIGASGGQEQTDGTVNSEHFSSWTARRLPVRR